jgi:hypothetical protein
MTRARNILNEHRHAGQIHSRSRHEVPVSERIRSNMPMHITGTLQPRAGTNQPDSDESPANIAPESFASRCAPLPPPFAFDILYCDHTCCTASSVFL